MSYQRPLTCTDCHKPLVPTAGYEPSQLCTCEVSARKVDKQRPKNTVTQSFQFNNPEFLHRQTIIDGQLKSEKTILMQREANSEISIKEERKDKRHLAAERENIAGLERQDKKHTLADIEHIKGLLREDRAHNEAGLEDLRAMKRRDKSYSAEERDKVKKQAEQDHAHRDSLMDQFRRI